MKCIFNCLKPKVSLLVGFSLTFYLFAANSAATIGLCINVKTDLGELGCPDGNAAGDGVADDTKPIQWAINYVADKDGGTVYCPAGTYKVTRILIKDGADLLGAGKEQTFFRPNPKDRGFSLFDLTGGSIREFTAYGTFPEDSGENWKCGRDKHGGPAHIIRAGDMPNGALIKSVRAIEARYDPLLTTGTKGLWVVDSEFDRAGRNVVSITATSGVDEEFVFANCRFGPLRWLYLIDIEPLHDDYVRNGIFLNCQFEGTDNGQYGTKENLWGCFLAFKGFERPGERKDVAVVGCEFKDAYVYINGVFPALHFVCNKVDSDMPVFVRTWNNLVGEFPDAVVEGNYFVGKRCWSQIISGVNFSGSSNFSFNTPSVANYSGLHSWCDCNAADIKLLNSVSNIEDFDFKELMYLCKKCPRELLERFYDGYEDWANGLVGWWELDGNTRDSSGKNNNGTIVGEASYQDGKFGQAIKLDGEGEYMMVGGEESNYDITKAITVTAWIKHLDSIMSTGGYKETKTIVSKGNSAWKLYMYSDTKIRFCCGGLSCGDCCASGSIDMFDLGWHHVAGVYDGVKLYVYIGGVMKGSVDASGEISTNNYKVCIGGNQQESGQQWRDLIDDVRIYNYSLSPEEIAFLAGLH